MEKKNNFYITTTLPYVNADLHMGHAVEFVRVDSIARYKRLCGYEVLFNTGADEHGLKIYRKAETENKTPQEYVDFYATRAKNLIHLLGVREDSFIRTTDLRHIKAAQAFWQLCDQNGFIYKAKYKVKYCAGCESEKTESDLVGGHCPDHQNLEMEEIDEENYFFKYSVFQEKLLNFYEQNPSFVVPDFRFNEIKAFVKQGLKDFSISRLKNKMPWGIEVPNDPDQVIYVWFDALVNYISTIGWPEDLEKFKQWWPVVQYCGKDNLRFQAAMWQAMLLAANLPNSKQIVINGFVTGPGGIKMSKTMGNTVDPLEIVTEFGAEALRYFLLREVSSFEDSPFSREQFIEAYNANLANGLGNLTSRIMKMAESYLLQPVEIKEEVSLEAEIEPFLSGYEINKAMDYIWNKIGELDLYIQENKPFSVYKENPNKAREMVEFLLKKLYNISILLEPFLPETALKIRDLIKNNKSPEAPLFLRKD